MVPVHEDCSLCGVTVPYYALSRCNRCKKLFCRNCLVNDEEGKPTCLRCAKRRLMPAAPRSKYAPLSQFLVRRAQYTDFVTLSFRFIEEILGDKLPDSAYSSERWWSNRLSHSASESWLTVGWMIENVNLAKKRVSFKKKVSTLRRTQKKRQRRKPLSPAFKALALKRKPKKPLGPSKTKIAKTLARYKNIGRQKAMPQPIKGKFKPKSAYEKKLYKPTEKPKQTA